MAYDNWISGIYSNYDGIFKYWECQDEITWLHDILQKHGLRGELWDESGEYKWKGKDIYEGFHRSQTTEGRNDARQETDHCKGNEE